ncbi:MAG: hypothetical protein M1818_008212 [Claussenomyces sp. TS43310]|nr:MAG: hypothetical protein M1818_008212 [Claussenomyces sp. TS43310]
MSVKRSRATYEADLQAKQSPYAFYGTPLPPWDPETRDDGSYVPVWKQEVTDERGRKRLHGAFTGGFSAGYFNTVGSKEGWTPSTFVSSRSNRRKQDQTTSQQKPEDFMDDEDLADAAEAQRLQTAESFAGLGSTEEEAARRGFLEDLFKTDGETMGVKLLKKMGWREGQGVGPKIRRKARLDAKDHPDGGHEDTHLFAPENTHMVKFIRKNDHKGLGYDGEAKLTPNNQRDELDKSDGEDDGGFGPVSTAVSKSKKVKKRARSGIGIGILNDTGSDDEDPYEIGPRISYNKVIGGEKKKKKPVAQGSIRPVFISKKAASAKAAANFRKCHDGRLPLDGFVLSSIPDTMLSVLTPEEKYAPLEIPEGWKSVKEPLTEAHSPAYMSTADAAKASKLNPKARAQLLGEAPLPGKSVFDYLSSAARDRLAAASGQANLPAALGEIPEGYSMTAEERQKELMSRIPKVDKDTAVAALGRGASGWMPYADDEGKRSRYRAFLEGQAGLRDELPSRAAGASNDDWLKELQEFANCAQIFKPMTGMMANRFTPSSASATAASATDAASSSSSGAASLLSKPAPKPEDPAEAAAKVGMFGPLTRSTRDFHPTRLLCKRFNVQPPAHASLDPERTGADGGSVSAGDGRDANKDLDLVSKTTLDDLMREHWDAANVTRPLGESADEVVRMEAREKPLVEPDRNEALEGERAGEAVFKAIFGDSDDDDD